MTTQLARWGNSLALRIPKSVAAEASVADGDAVDISVQDGAIIIRPAVRQYALDDLVAGITAENRHGETDWDAVAGNEVW